MINEGAEPNHHANKLRRDAERRSRSRRGLLFAWRWFERSPIKKMCGAAALQYHRM